MTISNEPIDGPVGLELWRRADQVLPGKGIFMTRSARYAGHDILPGFIAQASGCRAIDADGRHYIDLNCGNGPNLLGWLHPEVEEAARAQASLGDLMPFFPPVMIDFCERLLKWTDGFKWTIPVKCGSDALLLASRIARARTNKPNLLLFKRAYHGWAPEFSLNFEGAPADGLAHVRRLPWNDAEALDAMPLQEAETIAAIVLNPLEQSPGLITLAPSAAFIAAIERFRHRTGALVIVDDVRAGFRIHPQGSHKSMGLMPDMLCLGKTLGNGHSVAAVMGQADLWDSAERIIYTSTYIFSAVAFRAAITMLDIYERDHAFDRIMRAGERLIEGILAASKRCGRDTAFSGPPSHPTLRFANDENGAVIAAFCREAAKRGALFHPRLNWFLSAAHDDASIDEAISIADASLRALA